MTRRLDTSASGGELPPGAMEPPDGPTRRRVLELMAASTALASQACRRPVEHIVPFVEPPESTLPGVPVRYATTLTLGANAVGAVVESHDGRPTKVEGNELHPASLGGSAAWHQAAILDLYDPDRSREVSRRPDDGRAGEWQSASWDEWLEFWTVIGFTSGMSGGANIGVILQGFASPSLADAARRFRERFPVAHLVVHEPIDDVNAFEGARRFAGRALRPMAHLDRASCVLALDADFLHTESDAPRLAREYAKARGLAPGGGSRRRISRLYAVESALSVTGANADHRLALPPSQVLPFALRVAEYLRRGGLDLPTLGQAALEPELSEPAAVIAADLLAAGREAAIVIGRHQPPALHALGLLLQHALGSLGNTTTLGELRDTGWNDAAGLGKMAREIEAGVIDTVAVLGANPVYTAPPELRLGELIAGVERSFHLGSRRDETAELSRWHLPQAHDLEGWSDARAFDGTPSVVQPLIAPLFGGRTSLEVLHAMATDTFLSGHLLVRSYWREEILVSGESGESGEGADETETETETEGAVDLRGWAADRRWRRTLHDGLWGPASAQDAGEGAPEVAPEPEEGAPEAIASELAALRNADVGGGLALVLRPSATLFDGRFANNAWLQELPDPIAKTCWDNGLWMAAETARELGVEDGDRLRVEGRDASLEAPVLIVPGQAAGVLSLALGYGRQAAGRVGSGVGVDAYRLRHGDSPDGSYPVEARRVGGRRHRFAITQDHWRFAEERHLIHRLSVEDLADASRLAEAIPSHPDPLPLWQPDYDYEAGPQWGMAIDLHACIGCNACAIACVAENNVPVVGKEQVERGRHMHWLRVDRYFTGDDANATADFQPVLCQHCENAPCEEVCPVGATVHDSEGLNTMVYNRCIGTRYCSNNCPYKVRRFNFFNYTKDYPALVQMAQNPDVTVRSRGVMEKCTYCVQRLGRAKWEAKSEARPLGDGEARTACQQACPAAAIAFGDLRDLDSEVSRWKADGRDYTLLDELGTRPRTSYLARVRNLNPRWPGAEAGGGHP